MLYVLDEPSIGLHQRDNERLINTLQHLRDLGNTLIVVEHDEDTIRTADWLVDIGLARVNMVAKLSTKASRRGLKRQRIPSRVLTSPGARIGRAR